MSTVGRNDPCPCGSGKKYKKCCANKPSEDYAIKSPEEIRYKHHPIPPYEEIDYGEPVLNDFFFERNTISEYSAHRLLYSLLLMPEADILARAVTHKFIHRADKEKLRIKNIDDVETLVAMIDKLDPLNEGILQQRLLEKKDTSIQLILKELTKPKNTQFLEFSIRFLYETGADCSNELIEIIKHHQRDAYNVSQLCMLLGFYDNPISEKLLWDYYHYFKQNFPGETYCDGPLLGLGEIRTRRKERGMLDKNLP